MATQITQLSNIVDDYNLDKSSAVGAVGGITDQITRERIINNFDLWCLLCGDPNNQLKRQKFVICLIDTIHDHYTTKGSRMWKLWLAHYIIRRDILLPIVTINNNPIVVALKSDLLANNIYLFKKIDAIPYDETTKVAPPDIILNHSDWLDLIKAPECVEMGFELLTRWIKRRDEDYGYNLIGYCSESFNLPVGATLGSASDYTTAAAAAAAAAAADPFNAAAAAAVAAADPNAAALSAAAAANPTAAALSAAATTAANNVASFQNLSSQTTNRISSMVFVKYNVLTQYYSINWNGNGPSLYLADQGAPNLTKIGSGAWILQLGLGGIYDKGGTKGSGTRFNDQPGDKAIFEKANYEGILGYETFQLNNTGAGNEPQWEGLLPIPSISGTKTYTTVSALMSEKLKYTFKTQVRQFVFGKTVGTTFNKIFRYLKNITGGDKITNNLISSTSFFDVNEKGLSPTTDIKRLGDWSQSYEVKGSDIYLFATGDYLAAGIACYFNNVTTLLNLPLLPTNKADAGCLIMFNKTMSQKKTPLTCSAVTAASSSGPNFIFNNYSDFKEERRKMPKASFGGKPPKKKISRLMGGDPEIYNIGDVNTFIKILLNPDEYKISDSDLLLLLTTFKTTMIKNLLKIIVGTLWSHLSIRRQNISQKELQQFDEDTNVFYSEYKDRPPYYLEKPHSGYEKILKIKKNFKKIFTDSNGISEFEDKLIEYNTTIPENSTYVFQENIELEEPNQSPPFIIRDVDLTESYKQFMIGDTQMISEFLLNITLSVFVETDEFKKFLLDIKLKDYFEESDQTARKISYDEYLSYIINICALCNLQINEVSESDPVNEVSKSKVTLEQYRIFVINFACSNVLKHFIELFLEIQIDDKGIKFPFQLTIANILKLTTPRSENVIPRSNNPLVLKSAPRGAAKPYDRPANELRRQEALQIGIRAGGNLKVLKRRKELIKPKQPTPKQPTPKQQTPKQPAPKQPTPKQATPKQPTPKQATPKQATPKPATPKQATPKQSTPKQATPKQATPKQATPKPAVPKPAVPKQATPKPAVPKPAVPKPATPKQEKPKKALLVLDKKYRIKELKEVAKNNNIKLSKKVDDKYVALNKKELITTLNKRKLI